MKHDAIDSSEQVKCDVVSKIRRCAPAAVGLGCVDGNERGSEFIPELMESVKGGQMKRFLFVLWHRIALWRMSLRFPLTKELRRQPSFNVFQRLNLAREKFHSMKLEKTGHNKFAGYKYFELGDFLVPALKVFNECGLCAVVSFSDDIATMMIIPCDAPAGDKYITITSPMGSASLKGCHEVQNIGAVQTYQRRYLWVAALEIVEHDAIDSSEQVKDEVVSKIRHCAPAADVAEAAAELLSPERKDDLEDDAMKIVLAYKSLQFDQIISIWDSITENEEKAYLWGLLGRESKIRAFIKASKNKAQTVS